MNKKKIKILAVPANTGGCAYYRIIMPMEKLAEKFPDDVEVRFNENPLGLQRITEEDGRERISPPPEDFETTDLDWCDVMFTQNISNWGGPYTMNLIRTAKEKGKFVHYDTDDLLTNLYKGHRLYDVYRDQKLSELTQWFYHHADLVTVTQRKFAERISPFCQNTLAVVRNAVDYDLECWNLTKTPTPKKLCRMGWVGGIHHEEDVKEFRSVAMGVNAKVGHERVHWGFYGRPPLGPEEERDWQQDVWDNYEKYMTRGVHPRHKNFDVFNAMPGNQYGAMFTRFDVAIAPLQYNEFNDSKSEIKVMEAGRYGLPLVASDVGCYSDVIINGETGYLVSRDNPRSEWIKVLTKVSKDKKHREEMGRNLKQITDEAYDINKIVGGRFELYRDLLNLRRQVREHEHQNS